MEDNHVRMKPQTINTDEDFEISIAHALRIPPDDAKTVIVKFVEIMTKCIKINEGLRIRGLGHFYIKNKKDVTQKGLKGEMITNKGLKRVRFLPAGALKHKLNDSLIKSE